MVQINFARREICCKIVYYGPGVSGKTTNLEIIHKKVPDTSKGQLTSIATEGDRTLFFDLLPLDLGEIGGMKTKFQLYTVPGQVYYNSTRKLVLAGSDGIVFVADSGKDRMDDNIESLNNLSVNLRENGFNPETMAIVLQYNKRDLPGALPVEEMDAKLNPRKIPSFEAVAVKGEGVMATLKAVSKMVIEKMNKDLPSRPAVSVTPVAPSPEEKPVETPKPPVESAPPAPKPPEPIPPAAPPPPAPKPPEPVRRPEPRPAPLQTTHAHTHAHPHPHDSRSHPAKRSSNKAVVIAVVVAASIALAIILFLMMK
ncbi:MAG: hypothetical protein A2Z34_05540 [Planctomycetes bacterium RBG_16_59_8]|nr:MAG: hypothetical protein A2Z34_05540 [Planctomycetes bacterium RBG_16_59_8]